MWLAVSSGLLYGLLGYFGVKLIGSGISVFALSFWRFVVSMAFLSVIFLYKRPPLKRGQIKLHGKAFLAGAIFYVAPSILFFSASRYIGTGQAMVIFFVYPVFVMLLNWLFDKKPIKPLYFLSFGLILTGMIFLVDLREASFDFLGIGLSLLCALFYAIYVVLGKKDSLPALNGTMMVSAGCALSAGLFALVDNSLVLPTQWSQWANIIGIGVICSALPILLLLEAMKHISSDKASLLSVTEPLFTVFFGVVLLGEVLALNHVIGITLTLCGAMMVTVDFSKVAARRKKVVL